MKKQSEFWDSEYLLSRRINWLNALTVYITLIVVCGSAIVDILLGGLSTTTDRNLKYYTGETVASVLLLNPNLNYPATFPADFYEAYLEAEDYTLKGGELEVKSNQATTVQGYNHLTPYDPFNPQEDWISKFEDRTTRMALTIFLLSIIIGYLQSMVVRYSFRRDDLQYKKAK